MDHSQNLSIILPAKNEARSLERLLPGLKEEFPDAEIVVVDDGSDDDSVQICEQNQVKVISHPYSKGNGAAIKTGAQQATGDVLLFMDADSQHTREAARRLVNGFNDAYDMMVGARSMRSQASVPRLLANTFYNKLASWMVGHKVWDLTSGLRIAKADKFRKFLYMLPNGFSYPTTTTMAFFRAGYSVGYMPIHTELRIGKSHIRILRDGLRFLIIIFRIGTLYSPLKLFLPISALHLAAGISYYAYTFIVYNRFTNMSALLFLASLLIFFIGLVSEQITMLLFAKRRD